MLTIMDLTPSAPVTVTVAGSGTIYQPLSEARDRGEGDTGDLVRGVLDSPSGTNFTFGICTSLQRETESGWVEAPAALFDFETVAGGGERSRGRRFDAGPLRYVRWRFAFDVAGGTITFYIRGLGRRLGK